MEYRRLLGRNARYIVVALALVLAVILPTIVSAAQLTQRSIALSSSSADADGVTYTVQFTPPSNAAAFVVDFCSNSPAVGQPCTAPVGFSASSVSSTTVNFTDVAALDANTVRVTGSITQPTPVSVNLDNINNPTNSGTLYARIVTFDTVVNANAYESEVVVAGYQMTGKVDEGGAAIAITDTVGVSGAVLESITFCVSGAAITDACETTTTPVLSLGEQVGDVYALQPGTVSEGSIYTQISTNAASGAVVNLKSSALDCGGLVRAGAPTSCDIGPALTDGVDGTAARFGVRVLPGADLAGATGLFQAATASAYNGTSYTLNFAAGNATGVTSVFGDPFLDTGNAPANGKNMELNFGASVTNDTPAGLYSTDLSLIATGKF